jgi:hypothetical protein
MITEFRIEFDIPKQYSLIDAVVQSKGFYLQAGAIGDRVSTSMNVPRILIEVPDAGFALFWNKHLKSMLVKTFKKKGMSRHNSIAAADDLIKSMRSLWWTRLNNA